jgi:RNA polymerase-binding transcription factor DksA
MSYLNQTVLNEIQAKLTNNFIQLRQDIIEILMNSENANDHLTAKKIQNLSRDELVDITCQLSLPAIKGKTLTIKSIDAALNNIDIDMYGLCADCEKEIGLEALKINPTQQRCASCEIKYQKQKYNNFKL